MQSCKNLFAAGMAVSAVYLWGISEIDKPGARCGSLRGTLQQRQPQLECGLCTIALALHSDYYMFITGIVAAWGELLSGGLHIA